MAKENPQETPNTTFSEVKSIRRTCKYLAVIGTLVLAFGVCDHLHLLGGHHMEKPQPTPAMQEKPAQCNHGPISDNINDYHPRKHAQQPQQGKPNGQPQGQRPQHPQQQRPQVGGQWQPEQVKTTPPEELLNEFEHPAIKEDRTHERPEQREL